LATNIFVAFCLSGILEAENIVISKNSGLNDNLLFQDGKNVVNTPLIYAEKFYLPPLHIKLGLIKIFVKAVDQNSAGVMYLKVSFSG